MYGFNWMLLKIILYINKINFYWSIFSAQFLSKISLSASTVSLSLHSDIAPNTTLRGIVIYKKECRISRQTVAQINKVRRDRRMRKRESRPEVLIQTQRITRKTAADNEFKLCDWHGSLPGVGVHGQLWLVAITTQFKTEILKR